MAPSPLRPPAIQSLLVSAGWLQTRAGFFLSGCTFFAPPADHAAAVRPRPGKLSAYLTTLGLTLTNPATILSFTIIFAGFRLGQTAAGFLPAALLVLGVFLGSACW
jgi:hypothetical protein